MALFTGLNLVASATCLGLKNGRLYSVASTEPFRLEGTVEGDAEALCGHLRLAHSLTCYSCQSLTLTGKVRVYTSSQHFSVTALCVAMSRATHGNLLEVL